MTTPPNDPYGSSGYGDGESTHAVPEYSAGGTDYIEGTVDYEAGTDYATDSTPSEGGDSSSGTADAAKQQAQNVKDTTAQAGQQVAQTAKEQASQVAGDAKQQAQQLASQAKQEVSSQVTSQQDRATSSLRSLSEELRSMADASSQSGLGGTLVRQGADFTQQAADFLSDRDPSQLLDEVRGLARRRPAGFLVGAALAGVAIGRLSRGAMSARSSDGSSYDSSGFDALRSQSTGYDPYGQPASTAPGTASGWSPSAAQPAPILNEPYGEQQPPAGYDPGYGART